ncbi:GGDEF domain-containing protein [Phycicoccus jejuensis]|uniref:GGDEF domain-containing protein n=1 Tax=Phycicoccus jejuensis TaxID=367299 RepID=UPI00068EE097|nr:GGDEF domain-containing protein [Phycicoccus jejuensis]
MRPPSLPRPRDRETAARFGAVLCLVAGGLSVMMTSLVPQGMSTGMKAAVIGASLAMMVVGALLVVAGERLQSWLWLPVPLLGILTIVLSGLASRDASASGQVFLCAPVLFAASQLPGASAWLVTTCAVVADGVLVVSVTPSGDAAVDLLYVSVALVLSTWLLVRAGERNARLTDRLRELAAVDPLTGLVTRRVLDDAARSALSVADGDGGTALVLLDVDEFKTINDTWGHPTGDAVLVHLADTVRRHGGPGAVISRLGGDEIALLLPGSTHEAARRRASELVEAVRASPFQRAHDEAIALTISVGVAHAPTHAVDLRHLYAAADRALYVAKRAGRDQVGTVPAEVVTSG